MNSIREKMIDLSVKHLGYVALKHREAFIDAILAIEHRSKEIHADGCSLTVQMCPYPDRECKDCSELEPSRPATLADWGGAE